MGYITSIKVIPNDIVHTKIVLGIVPGRGGRHLRKQSSSLSPPSRKWREVEREKKRKKEYVGHDQCMFLALLPITSRFTELGGDNHNVMTEIKIQSQTCMIVKGKLMMHNAYAKRSEVINSF
jgi:hypothetical protein